MYPYTVDIIKIIMYGKGETQIAKEKPYFAVFRDGGFKDDDAFVNAEQIFQTYSPETERKVL